MTQTIENLFVYLVYSFDFVLLLIFLAFQRNRKLNKGLAVLSLNTIFAVLLSFIIDSTKGNDRIFYPLFTLFEYYAFSYFLYINTESKKYKILIQYATIVFTVFLTLYTLLTKYKNIDSIPIGIETILILIFSFFFLIEQVSDMNSQVIYNKHQFWIVVGIMIYLAGSFFIYIFANQVDEKTLRQFWFLTNVFYIIKNILFAIGIYIYSKQSKKAVSNQLRPTLN